MKCIKLNKNKKKKMKTKEIKSVKSVKSVKPVVKKNINEEIPVDILPEPTILENNSKTLDYKLKSGRIFAAPCSDELFSTLSRRTKIEYLDFCCRNDLKLSEIQDNFN